MLFAATEEQRLIEDPRTDYERSVGSLPIRKDHFNRIGGASSLEITQRAWPDLCMAARGCRGVLVVVCALFWYWPA